MDALHGEGSSEINYPSSVPSSPYNFVDLIFSSNQVMMMLSVANSTSYHSYFTIIFFLTQDELESMKAAVQGGDTFRTQIEVVHPTLRSLMGLREGEEAFHDLQMSLTRDPVTLQQVYTVAQIDVTAAVLAKREAQLAHAELEEEKLRTDALLHR